MRMKRGKGSERETSELEAALVGRLRNLDWPKPTTEVKQRCLDDILDRMAEMKKQEPNPSRRAESRSRGLGETHGLTRRVAALAHRQPPRLDQRPIRLATVLW